MRVRPAVEVGGIIGEQEIHIGEALAVVVCISFSPSLIPFSLPIAASSSSSFFHPLLIVYPPVYLTILAAFLFAKQAVEKEKESLVKIDLQVVEGGMMMIVLLGVDISRHFRS